MARPLILTNEPASFDRIRGLLGRQFAHPTIREHLRELNERYRAGHYQPYFQIHVGETPLFDDTTFNAWLNGTQYHRDIDKRMMIRELEEGLGPDTLDAIAVHFSAKVESIQRLDDGLVTAVLRKLERTSQPGPPS